MAKASSTKDETKTEDTNNSTGEVLVALPEILSVPDEAYCARHVETQLPHNEAKTLKRILHTLEFGGVKLADGTNITRPTHAVRWLLEQVGEAI